MAQAQAFLNAEIRTMDPSRPHAEALLVRDGRIEAVGTTAAIERRIASTGGPRWDLKGITLLPGLVDSHTHLVHQGLLPRRVDLAETRSLEEAYLAVRNGAESLPPGQLLLAERWDESRWRERRFPRREELDEISRTRPIVLRRVDGHVAVGNTAACQAISERLPGVDPDSGLLLEEASLHINQVFPTAPHATDEALETAQTRALALGITAVHDFAIPGYLRAYQRLHARGRLRIRAHVSLYVDHLGALEEAGMATGWGDDQLRLAGVKLFADGSLGGHTAALREPYRDQAGATGRLIYDPAKLRSVVERADRAGLRVSAHAIGDAAIDQVAPILARAAPRARHRIEHYELHTPDSEALLSGGRVVASMQPNFVGAWNRKGGLYEARIGTRARRANEFGRLLSAGIRVAFGSDCMPLDPWFGISGCVNAPFPRQRLRLPDALRCYTAAGADALGAPGLGRLKPRAHADFIGLRLQASRIGRAQVLATYVGGRLVHAAKATLAQNR